MKIFAGSGSAAEVRLAFLGLLLLPLFGGPLRGAESDAATPLPPLGGPTADAEAEPAGSPTPTAEGAKGSDTSALPESATVTFSDDWDWVRLNSGEWLKGEIKELQEDSFEFESDELDDLSLDWGDVAELHSKRTNTCLLVSKETLTGTVSVRDGKVTVVTKEGVKSFPRSELRSMIPGTPTELNYWSGKLSLGLTVRRGNTDSSDLSALFRLKRRSPMARTNLGYEGNFSNLDGTETTNNHRLTGRHDIFLTQRLYLTPLSVDANRDVFQNIAYRVTPGVGLGYDIVDTGTVEWTVGGGGGYQYTRYDTVQPGEDGSDGYAAALFSTHFEWELTEKIDFELDYDTTIGVPNTEDNTHHLLAMFEIDIYGDFTLDISFVWDRNSNPRTDADGVTPKKNDFRTYVGIGWDF